MSLLGKLLDAVRARRAGEAASASSTYGELVRRLAAGAPAKADTAEVVDSLLGRTGRSPEDLERDVARIAGHVARRQRCRRALVLEAGQLDAQEALSQARHALAVETARLKSELERATAGSAQATGQLEALAGDLEAVLLAAPEDLAQEFRAARSVWLEAEEAAREARAGLEGRHRGALFGAAAAPPAGGESEVRALEAAAVTAKGRAEEALTRLLAHEPALAALDRPAEEVPVTSAPAAQPFQVGVKAIETEEPAQVTRLPAWSVGTFRPGPGFDGGAR